MGLWHNRYNRYDTLCGDCAIDAALPLSLAHDPRLAREQAHFESHYAREAAAGIAPLSDYDRLRYTSPASTTIFPREFYYHLLSPLAGKKVLEIACGNGIDACLCAHNGARIHAYDLSRASIELTRRRARVNAVADRVHTQITGDFDHAFAGHTFDAIIGYAALHHLPLQGFADRVRQRLRPGGLAVFAEPVVNSPMLDRLRRCIPYWPHEITDDEKPLTDTDIAAFAQPFDRLVRREFQLASRIWPMFPDNWPLCLALHKLDAALLRCPPLRRFATVVVFAVYRDD